MKNFKKLTTMMLMLLAIFFFACNKDDSDEEKIYTPAEVKAELNQLSGEMSVYMDEMQNSEGIVAINSLISIANENDPFITKKSLNQSAIFSNIQKLLLPVEPESLKSSKEAVPFDFDGNVGIYTFQNSFPYWTKEPSDKIIIIFPSDTANLDVNDATLTIHNYTEVFIDNAYNPTYILADLYLDENKIVDLELTAEWVASGERIGEPTTFDITVYLVPFEFTGNLNLSGTSANIDFTISSVDGNIFSTSVDVVFENAEDSIPQNIDGYIQLSNVKFVVNVNAKAIADIFNAVEDGTSPYITFDQLFEAMNAEIDAYMMIDGIKAADIEISFVSTISSLNNPVDILFIYSDGTTESAMPYLESFGEDLDLFFLYLDDYYSGWNK